MMEAGQEEKLGLEVRPPADEAQSDCSPPTWPTPPLTSYTLPLSWASVLRVLDMTPTLLCTLVRPSPSSKPFSLPGTLKWEPTGLGHT